MEERCMAKIKSIEPNWELYHEIANRYLSRPAFKGTSLTPDVLVAGAKDAFANHGTYVPVEMALLQAQFESGMGREGRNPKKNPYNIGEWDNETKFKPKTLEHGVKAYYNTMARDYLSGGKNWADLLADGGFVSQVAKDKKGMPARYASNPEYEFNIRKQLGDMRVFIQQQLRH
jgi:hypothetical protein